MPSSVAIANGDFARATGVPIDFRKFNSGADLLAAMASGDVQVGYVDSSPFAAATSRGLDVRAFHLASISGTDEALVVRNGSGTDAVFVGIVVIALCAFAFSFGMRLVEGWLVPWHGKQ